MMRLWAQLPSHSQQWPFCQLLISLHGQTSSFLGYALWKTIVAEQGPDSPIKEKTELSAHSQTPSLFTSLQQLSTYELPKTKVCSVIITLSVGAQQRPTHPILKSLKDSFLPKSRQTCTSWGVVQCQSAMGCRISISAPTALLSHLQ